MPLLEKQAFKFMSIWESFLFTPVEEYFECVMIFLRLPIKCTFNQRADLVPSWTKVAIEVL